MNNNQLFGDPFNQFAGTVTGASITATQAVGTNTNVYITDITASADKANALLIVKSGATIIYEAQLQITAAGISVFGQQFGTPLKGTKGTVITAQVTGATGTCTVAINGYTLADA